MSEQHYDLVVAHYHEIGLKGRNRKVFETALIDNIKTSITGTGFVSVKNMPGRVAIRLRSDSDVAEMLSRLERVFGLSHFAPALETRADIDSMVETALRLAHGSRFESFQVRTKKGNTSLSDSSQSVNETVGQAIKDATGARVDLTHAEWTCHIEAVLNKALLYWQRIDGPGGLPVGTSGRVVALLSGGIDSPVAAWEIAKRGGSVDLVHFHGQPYTDRSSVRQVSRLAKHLAPWLLESRLWLVPFGEIQSEVVTSAPEKLRVVLYRRFMMRIAEALALREEAEAIVTGESLGQVASQTLRNIGVIEEPVHSLPVLRPLVGRDKIEIERLARRIGTYEISIDPYQDCCVLFVPRRVSTRARREDLMEAESHLDVGALVEKGLANSHLETFRPYFEPG
jgi:thiamine biosynthesis protein ThiI